MQISLNGELHTLDEGLDVAALLASLGLDPRKVAVERNLQIVPKSAYGATPVEDGDRFEIVHFIGGGAPQGDSVEEDRLVVAGRSFSSRLLVGTGKYKDFEETAAAIEASAASDR